MPKQIAINGKFLGAAPTGVHRVARELLLALDRLLCGDPVLAAALDCELLVPRGTTIDLDLKAVKIGSSGWFTWQFWEQLDLPRMAGKRPLISLCNLSPLAKHGGYTLIHDAQVYLTPASYSAPFRTWYRFALPRIARGNAKVLTVSHYSRSMLAQYGVAQLDRIAVIPNGVDHIKRIASENEVCQRLGLRPNTYAVALANTQAHKNIRVLLEAFALDALAETKLVLVGAAGARDFVTIGASPPPNVVFAGRVSDGSLRALYESAACLAFPSTTEGFGLPPLEAMLVGCPVVAAPCGALPEVCGDAAFYVDPADAAGWALAISNLVGNQALHKERAAAGRTHASTFTWETSARALIEIIQA